MKTIFSEVKNPLDEIDRKLDISEENTSEPGNMAIVTIQRKHKDK